MMIYAKLIDTYYILKYQKLLLFIINYQKIGLPKGKF